jgi:hypothetical protein
MEKYLIILVLLASIYYIQNKLKDTEGFADAPAQSLGGVDDTNAINTLAQIAKQLMAGGVTVPGSMTLLGNMVFSNAGANFITINKGTANDAKTIQIWNSDSQLILVGKNDANTDYSWPGIVLDTKKSNINTNSMNVAGPLNVGANLDVKSVITVANNDNGNIMNPNTVTRINARGIIFGGPNNGYEANSAQISAGLHQADSLCMVGMGKPGAGRKIDMWAEERVAIHGSLVVDGNQSVGGTMSANILRCNELHVGPYMFHQEGPYLVIRCDGVGGDARWAYRSGTSWG